MSEETYKKYERAVLASGRLKSNVELSWRKQGGDLVFEKGDLLAKVWGDANETDWRWELMDESRSEIARGRAKTIEEAKKAAEQAVAKNSLSSDKSDVALGAKMKGKIDGL